jgi:hypothetical protein
LAMELRQNNEMMAKQDRYNRLEAVTSAAHNITNKPKEIFNPSRLWGLSYSDVVGFGSTGIRESTSASSVLDLNSRR